MPMSQRLNGRVWHSYAYRHYKRSRTDSNCYFQRLHVTLRPQIMLRASSLHTCGHSAFCSGLNVSMYIRIGIKLTFQVLALRMSKNVLPGVFHSRVCVTSGFGRIGRLVLRAALKKGIEASLSHTLPRKTIPTAASWAFM